MELRGKIRSLMIQNLFLNTARGVKKSFEIKICLLCSLVKILKYHTQALSVVLSDS